MLLPALALPLLLATPTGPPLKVLLLDGSHRQGPVLGIAGGTLQVDSSGRGKQAIALADIDRIIPGGKQEAAPPARLHFGKDQALPVLAITAAAGGRLSFHLPGGARGQVPLERLRAFRGKGEAPEFQRDLAGPRPPQRDYLYLRRQGEIVKVAGLITGTTPGQLLFDFAGRQRKIPFDRIYGAITGGKEEKKAENRQPCRLHFHGGGQLGGRIEKAGPERLYLHHHLVGTIHFSWRQLHRVDCSRDRILDLSTARPLSLESRGAFGGRPPLARGKTVDGNPLQVAGRRFDRGICLLPFHRITFAIPPGFTHFQAWFGIADETRGQGRVQCRVLAGDRELFAGLIRGGEQAREVRLPLDGARQLTLVVDFGPELHLGDHCLIGAPRLLALPEED